MQIKRFFILLLTLCMLIPSAVAEPLLKDAQPNWLIAKQGDTYEKVAEIILPEGYTLLESAPTGLEPELYYLPDDAESPVRFIYYTTGYGDPQALAEAALESYVTFYTTFEASEIAEITLSEKNCLSFNYICSYAGPDGVTPVYEQTAVCYYPVEGDCFIACILSLSFDSQDKCLNAEALSEMLLTTADALIM